MAVMNTNRLTTAARPLAGTMQQQPMGTGAPGQNSQSAQQSPALAAMAGQATPLNTTARGIQQTATNGQATASGGQTNQAAVNTPRTDIVNSPGQVNTGPQDKIYADQLAASDKAWDYMQSNNANTTSALQRRNASNAALSGFSVGGGSYLAGQRQAAVSGINSANQAAMNWLNQRTGTMQGAAGLAAGAANTNANIGNQTALDTAHRNAGIDDAKTAAQATTNAQTVENSVAKFQGDLKGYGIDPVSRKGVTNAIAAAIQDQLQNAPNGSPEQSAAQGRMAKYSSVLATLRGRWGSKAQAGLSWDAFLKKAEQQGMFNGI